MYEKQYNSAWDTQSRAFDLRARYPERFHALPYSLNTWREAVKRHHILGEPNDMDTITADLLIAAVDSLKDNIRDGYLCRGAISFGKDSSVVLIILLLALMELKQEGFQPKHRALVTHSSTKIEIPTVDFLAKSNWNELTLFAKIYDLPVDFVLAEPSFTSSWLGRVVTGRGLPTTVASSVRQCTNDLKINPMNRVTKRYFDSNGINPKQVKILLLLGSRDSESEIRKKNIARFGGQEDPLAVTKLEKSGEFVSYYIKNFSTSMVWEVLQFSGNDEGKLIPSYKLSYDDTVKTYADSSGECVMFSNSIKEKQNQQPCGARHGCVLCLCTGEKDKTMDNFLANEEYEHLRSLHRVRMYLAKTHWRWDQRTLINRSIDSWGFVKVQNDLYSFDKCKKILHALLSCDAMEEDRAHDHSLRYYNDELPQTEYNERMTNPQFRFVTFKDIVLIDFLWAFHSFSDEPNAALKLWDKVYNKGEYDRLTEVDEMEFCPKTPQPSPYYMYVGENWDSSLNVNLMGLRNPLVEAFAADCPGVGLETRSRTNKVTKEPESFLCMEMNEGQELDVSAEALEMIADDLEYYVKRNGYGPSDASIRMLQEGSIQIAKGKQSSYQNMLERCQYFQYMGITSLTTLDELMQRSDVKLYTKKQHEQILKLVPSKRGALQLNLASEAISSKDQELLSESEKLMVKAEVQMNLFFEQQRNQQVDAPVELKPKKAERIKVQLVDMAPGANSEQSALLDQMTFW